MITLTKEQIAKYVLSNPSYFDFMPQEIKGRLNTNEDLSVQQIQKKFIQEIYEPLTPKEIEQLTPYTQKAESELYPILHKVGITISEPIKWVVIKAKNGFNWNTCYTQGGVIILSQNAIDKNDNLTRTLAHEMIHIFQRKYPKLFRNFYEQKMNFTDFKPTEKQLQNIDDLGISEIYVENPDICKLGLMVYKEKYLPITVVLPEKNYPVNIVLEIDENNVYWKNKNFHMMNGYDKLNLDQPNEMFAYKVTKNIT